MTDLPGAAIAPGDTPADPYGMNLSAQPTPDQTSRYYVRQAARVKLLTSIDPTLTQLPNSVQDLANLNVDANNLYGQMSAYKGTQLASMNKDQLEQYSPGVQRAFFSEMDTVQQQALSAAGYTPPKADAQGSSGWLGSILGDVSDAAGTAFGAIKPVTDYTLRPVLQGLGEVGQVTADMYRAIRTQPAWVQELAAAGAVAATIATGGAAAGVFGEGALATAAGALPMGASAMGGAFATAGIVNSLQGNWDYWGQAWQLGNAGERVWTPHTLSQAGYIIGSDGNLLELAKTMAYDDPMEIAKDFGEDPASLGQHRLGLVARLATRSGQFGTPEYQAAYQAIEQMSMDPQFQKAVQLLHDSKISPGRDLARLVGLRPGTTAYNLTSGLGDAAFQITTDPILAAGSELKAARAIRYGFNADLMASNMASAGYKSWEAYADAMASRSAMVNQYQELADLMGTDGGMETLYRRRKNLRGILGVMNDWQQAERPNSAWDLDLVKDFFRSQQAGQALVSGKGMTAVHGLIEMPHLNPFSDAAGRIREQLSRAIDFTADHAQDGRFELTGAVNPAYDQYANMNGLTKSIVTIVNGVPFVNKIPQMGAAALKLLTTPVPRYGFLALDEAGILGADAMRESRAFTETLRAVGVPSWLRNDVFSQFVTAPNAGARRMILESFYRTSFEGAGLASTTEGRELMENFIDHINQAYIGGAHTATVAQDASRLLAIPDIREMRRAISQTTILNKMLNVADNHILTAATSRFWKPATLLRIGFIPRIVTDELLSYLARFGLVGYLTPFQSRLAATAEGDLPLHAQYIENAANTLTSGFQKLSFGKLNTSGVDDMTNAMLQYYTRGVRKLATDGLFGLNQTSGLGKVLAPENSLRGLVLAGVPDDFVRYAREAMQEDGPFRQAFLSRISARHVSQIGDVMSNQDIQQQLARKTSDGDIEPIAAHNYGNQREHVNALSPSGREAQVNNQHVSLKTRLPSQQLYDWAMSRPGPLVDNPLSRLGLDTEGLARRLQTHGLENLTETERYAVSQLVTDAPNAIPGVSAKLQGHAEWLQDQADRMAETISTPEDEARWAGLQRKADQVKAWAREVGTAANRGEALNALSYTLDGEDSELVPWDVLGHAMGLNRTLDSWMGGVMAYPKQLGVFERFASEQEMNDSLLKYLRDQSYTPESQHWFDNLEHSSRGAISGVPAAQAPQRGTTRLWSPNLSHGARTAMDDMLAENGRLGVDDIASYLASHNVPVDRQTVEALTEMARWERTYRAGGPSIWNEGPATAMVVENPQMARNVSKALHTLAGEPEADAIAELQSSVTGMGRFRVNHGVPGVSNPISFGPYRGYAVNPTFVSKDAYQVFGAGYPAIPAGARQEFIDNYHALEQRVLGAEKRSVPEDWNPAEWAAYKRGDYAEFSRLRGYTPAEIADWEKLQSYQHGMEPDVTVPYPEGSAYAGEQAASTTPEAILQAKPHLLAPEGTPGLTYEQLIEEHLQAELGYLRALHVGHYENIPMTGPATIKPYVAWNGPQFTNVISDGILDRTSPSMVDDSGHVVVDPGLATADLNAGLPYFRGQATLKEHNPIKFSEYAPRPGNHVGVTTDLPTFNAHQPISDEMAMALNGMAGGFDASGKPLGEGAQRIVINANQRNARHASDWLEAIGADYEFYTKPGTKMPKWATDRLKPADIHVGDIPIEYTNLPDEVAHATLDQHGNRIIRIDQNKVDFMNGRMEERSYLTGAKTSAGDPRLSQEMLPGWGDHPTFQFMRPEDLNKALNDSGHTFNDWVLAHEMGHHAMGHIYYGNAVDDSASELWKQERQADRWAAQFLGIDLPLTDPRSYRLSRAVGKTGVDMDKLSVLMQKMGPDAYRQFLGNLESARLLYGDNVQGDIEALRHMQAMWDIPVTGDGTLMVPGADLSQAPQPLWPVMSPYMNDLNMHARGYVASGADSNGIPEEILPREAVAKKLAVDPETSRPRAFVDWSFNKIGTVIDKTFREPAAFYQYMRNRRAMDALYQSWRDPALFDLEKGTFAKIAQKQMASDTRTAVGSMTPDQRSQLINAGQLLGMEAPTAQQVARTQAQNSVDYLRNAGHDALADTLAQAKPMQTVEEKMQELLGRAKQGDYSWVDPGDVATVKAAVANDAIHAKSAQDMAVVRTVQDMTPFIHDHRVRTQFQQYVNNIMPFWYAEDQFMRRWWRTFVFDPTVIRKAQLLHMGLKSSGVVSTDPSGNDVFTYPGSAAFMAVLSKIPFLHDKIPVLNTMTGQLSMTMPGMENFGDPSLSPWASIPLKQIASVFPEMQGGVSQLTGGYDRGVLRSFIPPQFMRFYDAISPSDSDRALASAMMTAMQIMEANGQGLKDDATAAERETYMDNVRNHARTVLLAQAMWGFLVPAPPTPRQVGVDTSGLSFDKNFLNAPEETLRPDYLELVRNLGVEKGTQRFLEEHPDNTPEDLVNRNIAYSKGFTERESGAPLPPVASAEAFMQKNSKWISQYRFAGPWLIPAPAADEQGNVINQTAYKDQMAVGFRRLEAPQDFLEGLKFATGSSTYFDTMDKFQQLLASAQSAAGRAQVNEMQTEFQTQYFASHPLFADQLQSSQGRERRQNILAEMRLALQDPATPPSPQTTLYADMLDVWDRYQAYLLQFAGRSGTSVTKRKANAHTVLTNWMADYTAQHPDAATFWTAVLKPEIGNG